MKYGRPAHKSAQNCTALHSKISEDESTVSRIMKSDVKNSPKIMKNDEALSIDKL